MREPPYATELKPYGRALVELGRRRVEVLCLSGDLTRQTEVDLFQAEFPDRFIHGGMAEANMMGMAGALARCGFLPFVHTFGVFATRRPYDQIANAIAYPGLPVRIIGFMPGVSTPGGPSHQAIDDVALMRALPNMTVIDVADATQTHQVVEAIAEAGLGRPLRRIGLRDTFAEGAADTGYLFAKYGLSTQAIVETIWSALGKPGRAPTAPVAVGNATSGGGRYSPVLPRPVLNKSLGAS
jgi:transketolase C-terminal domain/subunit